MTLRERIADWLTGGALTKAEREVSYWRDHMVLEIYNPLLDERNRDIIAAQRRLDRIASLETPRCAHIGRKMARIARGEE